MNILDKANLEDAKLLLLWEWSSSPHKCLVQHSYLQDRVIGCERNDHVFFCDNLMNDHMLFWDPLHTLFCWYWHQFCKPNSIKLGYFISSSTRWRVSPLASLKCGKKCCSMHRSSLIPSIVWDYLWYQNWNFLHSEFEFQSSSSLKSNRGSLKTPKHLSGALGSMITCSWLWSRVGKAQTSTKGNSSQFNIPVHCKLLRSQCNAMDFRLDLAMDS